jgi:hypothetical protein
MATQIPNQFTLFELTENEQLAGQHLSIAQTQVIQNMLSEYCIQKLNLPYTPNDHMAYVQAEAELTGQIGILKAILDASTAATETILQRTQEQN